MSVLFQYFFFKEEVNKKAAVQFKPEILWKAHGKNEETCYNRSGRGGCVG